MLRNAKELDIQSKKLGWLVCYGHGELDHKGERLSYPTLSRKPEIQVIKSEISALDEQSENLIDLDKEIVSSSTNVCLVIGISLSLFTQFRLFSLNRI